MARPYSDDPDMPVKPYTDNPHTIDDMEDVEDNHPEHSLPTPEGQRVTAALDNGTSRTMMDTKGKKYLIIGSVGVVVCLVLIIALSVSLSDRGGGGGNASAASKQPSATFTAVVEYLSGFEGIFADRDQLLKDGTPQNLAASWMADDAYAAIPTTDYVDEAFPFVQRYALAVLYYALNGNNWTNQYSFLSHSSECAAWQQPYTPDKLGSDLICGVQCDGNGRVSNLLIPANRLYGSLPSELRLLPSLTHLSFYDNVITGELPSGMQTLTDLEFLSMEENFLFGPVPSWLGSLTNLEFLNFGYNHFSGTFPSEMAQMQKLIEVSFESNQMTGNIHGAFNGIPTLESLFMGGNAFHEQLNEDFLMNADALFHLDLSDNKFSGTLPTHIVNLYLLDVRNNTFTGPFPDISGASDKLVYMAINDNKFSGRIEPYIEQLTDLMHLDMSNNLFTGDMPTELGKLTNLEYLFLANNPRFNFGAIPDLGNLTKLKALNLKNTKRNGFFPEYVGSSLTDLIVLELSQNALSGSLPANLETLTNLGLLSTFETDLTGDATEVCTYGNITEILLDCSFGPCPCCEASVGCCQNGNCTDLALRDLTYYLRVGYPKTQHVFSEDILPQ